MAGFSKIRHVSFTSKMRSRAKRKFKKAINPYYGTKTMGNLHPFRRAKSRWYRATTVNTRQLLFGKSNRQKTGKAHNKASRKSASVERERVDYTTKNFYKAKRIINPAWLILLVASPIFLFGLPLVTLVIIATFTLWFKYSPHVLVWTRDHKLRYADHHLWNDYKLQLKFPQAPSDPTSKDNDDLDF